MFVDLRYADKTSASDLWQKHHRRAANCGPVRLPLRFMKTTLKNVNWTFLSKATQSLEFFAMAQPAEKGTFDIGFVEIFFFKKADW